MIAATMWTEVARYCQWPGDQIGVRQVAETDGRLEAIDTSRHGPPFSSATMPVTTGSWLVAPAQAVPAPWRDLQVNGEAGDVSTPAAAYGVSSASISNIGAAPSIQRCIHRWHPENISYNVNWLTRFRRSCG
jgi:hypothetical protein